VPDAPARQWPDGELPCHAGRNPRRTGPRHGAALDAGVHRPQDRAEKQDSERNAAKRWLATHGGRLKNLRPIYLGDDLFACQPVAEAIRAAGGDVLLTAKPSAHKALYDFMHGATLNEQTITQKAPGKRLTHRYRWFTDAPLRDGRDAMPVNWVGVTITDARGVGRKCQG